MSNRRENRLAVGRRKMPGFKKTGLAARLV